MKSVNEAHARMPKIVDLLEASEAPAELKQFGCTIKRCSTQSSPGTRRESQMALPRG